MIELSEKNISLEKCPALVLNADYRPLSYYPLSLWSWQDSIKSVYLDRVTIVNNYDRVIRSPSFSMKLPTSSWQLHLADLNVVSAHNYQVLPVDGLRDVWTLFFDFE